MAAMPAHVIEIILSYLPVKSLKRFKSVSKEWKSLISSTYFINLHLHNNRSRSQFLIGEVSMNSSCCLETRAVDSNLTLTNKFFLPKQFDDKKEKYVHVVDSCHGLVVLRVMYYDNDDTFYDRYDLILWNPSTNNYMVLPPVHFPDSQERGFYYGLGYDKSTNDYKLVMFAYVYVYEGQDEDEVYSKTYSRHVYSAKRNSWGPPHVKNTDDMNPVGNYNKVVVNDHILHWRFYDHQRNNNKKVEVRGFDICTEEWLEAVPFPPLVTGDRVEGHRLSVLDNCFCLFHYSHRHRQSHVWVMKEYGVKESWTKLFSSSYNGTGIFMKIITPPIAYFDGQLLIELEGASGKFCWYNLKDKTLRPTGNRNCLTRTLCTESLVPIPFSDTTKEQFTGSFDRECTKKVMELRP